MTRPADDTTKPSRLNRRRKKRWKIADFIEAGLTDCARVAMLFTAGTSSTGRRNLVRTKGEKIAAAYRGFFMSVIQHGVMPCLFCYGGLITGSVRRWLHLWAVFDPVFSPSPDSVETISGGYSITKGVTA